MIRYKSTRGSENQLTSGQAIIKGIAEDRGLYVPDAIPKLPLTPDELALMPYKEVAFHIIRAFFDDYPDDDLRACVDGAYDGKFEADDVVPVVHAGSADFLELYHGRTAAFKDMALAILPYLLTAAMRREHEDKKVCILTATSGDTGKAALEGFADVPGTEIIVFFPNKGVSEVQERQMVSQKGANTHVFAINGNFDDAQTGVKKIFADPAIERELAEAGVRLSSANSINIGRLVPQVAYYVYAYTRLIARGRIKSGDKVNIVVPTGNFGNILAAYYAGEMGIPVNRFICASNKNKVLTDFINTGVYDANREFYLTNSPSMDILVSSNLERLLYHLSGNDGAEVARLMEALDTDRRYEVSDKIRSGMSRFYGGFADVDMTNDAIGEMYRENDYLIDTHTAVAYKVYENYVEETGDTTPALIASTASAYKFADSVADSIGIGRGSNGFESIRRVYEATGVPVPSCLSDLEDAEIRFRDVVDVKDMPEAVKKSLK